MAKKLLQRRSEKSSYKLLFKELQLDEVTDFRIPSHMFYLVLRNIKYKISKYTLFQESIPAGARLEAILRWLATGESYYT